MRWGIHGLHIHGRCSFKMVKNCHGGKKERGSDDMTKPITDRPLQCPGRKPMEYDEEIAAEVCDRLSQGESLRSICEDPRLPSHQTIYKWAAVQPIFKTAYARAREAQMDKWSDDIVEIADDAKNEYVDRIGKDGEVERVPERSRRVASQPLQRLGGHREYGARPRRTRPRRSPHPSASPPGWAAT